MITLIALIMAFVGGFVTATLIYRKNSKVQVIANRGVEQIKSRFEK